MDIQIRTEILGSPEFVTAFEQFAEAHGSKISIQKKEERQDATELQFGLAEVAAIVTIIQGTVYLGREFASLISAWLSDRPGEKVVIRTIVGHEEITSDQDVDMVSERLRAAAGIE